MDIKKVDEAAPVAYPTFDEFQADRRAFLKKLAAPVVLVTLGETSALALPGESSAPSAAAAPASASAPEGSTPSPRRPPHPPSPGGMRRPDPKPRPIAPKPKKDKRHKPGKDDDHKNTTSRTKAEKKSGTKGSGAEKKPTRRPHKTGGKPGRPWPPTRRPPSPTPKPK